MYIRRENEWKIGCLSLPSLYAKCVKPRGEGVGEGREGREGGGESVVIIIPHSAASAQSRYTWTQTKGEVAPSTSHG